MTLDQQLLFAIAVEAQGIGLRLAALESIANWWIVAGLCSGITAGLLVWMQVMRGKSQKNIW